MLLKIRIVANASKERIKKEEPIKLYITSPPIDGKANKSIISFFSKKLKISKSKITIVKGEKSKEKILDIDISEEELNKKLSLIWEN